MAIQRSITNFEAVVSNMRAERRPEPIVLRGPDGSWDKQGVMREAIRLARMLGRSCGLTWSQKLSISLKTAWAKARAAGRPASPSQVDRRWSKQRLVQSARTASSLEALS